MILLLFEVYLIKDFHGILDGLKTAILKGDTFEEPAVEFKTINEDITFNLA